MQCLKCHYSIDLRSRSLDQAKHWCDERLAQRARFVANDTSMPAALHLDNVTEKDAGIYRCRVDFRHSPTRHFRYKLIVVRKLYNLSYISSKWMFTILFCILLLQYNVYISRTTDLLTRPTVATIKSFSKVAIRMISAMRAMLVCVGETS